MSAEAGKKILRYYETHATTNQPAWKPNPLEDTVVTNNSATPTMTSNKRRKNRSTLLVTNPYGKAPTTSATGLTYHAHALQATKVLSQESTAIKNYTSSSQSDGNEGTINKANGEKQ
jgi:hypothetical protein